MEHKSREGNIQYLSTKEFAHLYGITTQTVHKNYCLNGHCYGVVPFKAPNRMLRWPEQEVLKAFYRDKRAVDFSLTNTGGKI